MYDFTCEHCSGIVRPPRHVEREALRHSGGFVVLEDVPIGVCGTLRRPISTLLWCAAWPRSAAAIVRRNGPFRTRRSLRTAYGVLATQLERVNAEISSEQPLEAPCKHSARRPLVVRRIASRSTAQIGLGFMPFEQGQRWRRTLGQELLLFRGFLQPKTARSIFPVQLIEAHFVFLTKWASMSIPQWKDRSLAVCVSKESSAEK